MFTIHKLTRSIAAALGLALAAAGAAQAQSVGTTFPPGFPEIMDESLGKPLIGFGGDKIVYPVKRTPVIFVHGNGGTPYYTGCAQYGADIDLMANYFAANGWAPSELWALGYQGTQCEPNGGLAQWFVAYNADESHSHAANLPDLTKFISAVMSYTGASKVDIVAHDMGVTLVRQWAMVNAARKLVRRFVAIDGPNQGTGMCAPVVGNGWAGVGFTPDSTLCQEIGSPNTPFLTALNKAADGRRISPSDTLVIRNGDTSFPFIAASDGLVAGAPQVDVNNMPIDFSTSPSISGGKEIVMYGMQSVPGSSGGGTAHAGIANSQDTWKTALDFLKKR